MNRLPFFATAVLLAIALTLLLDIGSRQGVAFARTNDQGANTPATGLPTISARCRRAKRSRRTRRASRTRTDSPTSATPTSGWPTTTQSLELPTPPTPLTDADEGKAIKVQVSFTDDSGNDDTLTSAATDAVSAAPQPNTPATGAPTISGTAQVGETLTADTSGIADDDGLGTPTSPTSGLRMTPKSQVPPARPIPWLTPTRASPSRCG